MDDSDFVSFLFYNGFSLATFRYDSVIYSGGSNGYSVRTACETTAVNGDSCPLTVMYRQFVSAIFLTGKVNLVLA